MRRSAGDNEYLHRDFHGALSVGLEYLRENYGEQAVRDYLAQFARAFFAPLTDSIKQRGLVALEEYFRSIYDREGGEVEFARSEDELRIEVKTCPAVSHMREKGYPVATLFHETSASVNRAICEGTPFLAELLDYDEETGSCVQRFTRKQGPA